MKLCALWDCTRPFTLKPSWVLPSLYIVFYSSLRFMLTDDLSSIILLNTHVTVNPPSSQRSIRNIRGVGKWVREVTSAWRTWIHVQYLIAAVIVNRDITFQKTKGGKEENVFKQFIYIYLFSYFFVFVEGTKRFNIAIIMY